MSVAKKGVFEDRFLRSEQVFWRDMHLVSRLAVVFRLLKGFSPARVLDFGCSWGYFTAFLRRKGFEAVGVDVDKDRVLLGEKVYGKGFLFPTKSGYLPFEDQSFDSVLAIDVVEHVPVLQVDASLKQIHRVLKKNGVLIFVVPASHFFYKVLDLGFWFSGHRHYSQKQAQELAEKNGFVVEKIFESGSLFFTLVMVLPYAFFHTFLNRVYYGLGLGKILGPVLGKLRLPGFFKKTLNKASNFLLKLCERDFSLEKKQGATLFAVFRKK